MLCFCKSVVGGATYALNSSGPRTVPCGTPVVMASTSDTPLFTRTTHVRYTGKMSARGGRHR